jgi:hypothetical protein
MYIDSVWVRDNESTIMYEFQTNTNFIETTEKSTIHYVIDLLLFYDINTLLHPIRKKQTHTL